MAVSAISSNEKPPGIDAATAESARIQVLCADHEVVCDIFTGIPIALIPWFTNLKSQLDFVLCCTHLPVDAALNEYYVTIDPSNLKACTSRR